MPHVDVIDEMKLARDRLIRFAEAHGGKRGGSLLSDRIAEDFAQLIEHVDEERREWEKVLNFLMDREAEEDDAKHD